MIKRFASLLAKPRSLYADVDLDHIELASEQLILGVRLKWSNTTLEALDIGNVAIQIYHRANETPLHFSYNGRFVRIPYQNGVSKVAGATSFLIGAGATQTQCLRFLTYDINDLSVGKYAAEVHSTVADGTYVHEFELEVCSQIKHQAAASESEKRETGALSSIYSRAMRIGTA